MPEIEVDRPELDVLVTVGGVSLGVGILAVRNGLVGSQELRAALTTVSGFELCIAAVREGLLGRPITDGVGLRARLAEAAEKTKKLPAWFGASGSGHAMGVGLPHREAYIVLGRRLPGIFGSSAARRAVLPAEVALELVNAASQAGEPICQAPRPGEMPQGVLYAPDLIHRPSWRFRVSSPHRVILSNKAASAMRFGRGHFETLFANRADPWKYTSPYEKTKYEQTLSLIPPGRIGHALELACAEGHFTVQLAARVEKLISADISQIALDRAAERCAGFDHVCFQQIDLIKDKLPGEQDLIVCSEVLYFADNLEKLRSVGEKLAEALKPAGYLIAAHMNLVVDEPDRTGFDYDLPFGAKVIGEILASSPLLQRIKELRTPLYRIQLFQRQPKSDLQAPQDAAEIVEMPQPTALRSEIATHVLWGGGSPQHGLESQVESTYQLPILTYHRVAPQGSVGMAKWRVTPEVFEEQLRYLRDSGYYSVTLEGWQAAVETKRPLPGRAVMLTFDDGYRDFLTHAWPLIKQFGFSAMVFLVTEAIGKTNAWDHKYGDMVPLLGWEEIRQLQEEGVDFGSHAATHRPLTSLSLVEVVREAARSRATLQAALGLAASAFCYPYGSEDRAIRHLVGACGYLYGLTTRHDLAKFSDSPLSIPRLEVIGDDNLERFVARLANASRSNLEIVIYNIHR